MAKDIKDMSKPELVAYIDKIKDSHQKEVEGLNNLIDDPDGAIVLLKQELENVTAENLDLKSVVEKCDEKIEELQNTVNEQEAIIAELNTANAKSAPVVAKSNNVIVVDGKRYEVRIKKFIHAGTEYNATTLTEKAAKEMLAKKSSVLRAL